MNPSDYTLDYLISKEILQTRFNRLTTWQKFILILWLMGYRPVEIGRMVGTSRQNITDVINEAKMKLGVYYTMEAQQNERRDRKGSSNLVS